MKQKYKMDLIGIMECILIAADKFITENGQCKNAVKNHACDDQDCAYCAMSAAVRILRREGILKCKPK